MGKTLRELSLGATVWIEEENSLVLYEVAGFNVHADGTATMVRKEQTETWITLPSVTEERSYIDSELDFTMQSFAAKYSARHAIALREVAVQCKEVGGSFTEVQRKVFALSATEVSGLGTWGVENSQLPLYTSNETRIKGNFYPWALRSWRMYPGNDYLYYSRVKDTGEVDEWYGYSAALVPAFVINDDISISDEAVDGGYEIYFPDATATATPIAPAFITIDANADNIFQWAHDSSSGSPQLKAELQIRLDDSGWSTLASIAGPETSVKIPSGTISGGRYAWRVRGYNQDGVPGPWSKEVWIIAQGAPSAPIVSIDGNSPRPNIKWLAEGQQAYHLVVGNYDSGVLYGDEKNYKIPFFLPDGTIDVRVRVQNRLGAWSDWGQASATITNVPPGNILLQVGVQKERAVLSWNGAPEAVAYYVLRDSIPIAMTVGSYYEDRLTVGAHTYTILGVDTSDNYTVSNAVAHETVVHGAVIGLLPTPEWIALKCRRGGRPTHNVSVQPIVAFHHYAGRELPVADVSSFRSTTDDFSFTLLGREMLERIAAITGKLVMYKDGDGEIVVGILERLYANIRRKSDVEFTIHRIDWSDGIEYTI